MKRFDRTSRDPSQLPKRNVSGRHWRVAAVDHVDEIRFSEVGLIGPTPPARQIEVSRCCSSARCRRVRYPHPNLLRQARASAAGFAGILLAVIGARDSARFENA